MTRMEPFRPGSLVVGQTRLDIEIEDQLADEFMQQFAKKTLRGGGLALPDRVADQTGAIDIDRARLHLNRRHTRV